eukprot:12635811-Ditylum_brightwellii.AAC.1
MARSIWYLQTTITRELYGTPMLSTVRLLHVASSRRSNVEAIALVGDSNGKGGIVDGIIQAIGDDHLHPDCAFMVEVLRNVFTNALGDVNNVPKNTATENFSAKNTPGRMSAQTQQQQQYGGNMHNMYAMAPSPAPGLDPVNKMTGAAGDHPLAMMFGSNAATPASSAYGHQQGIQAGTQHNAAASQGRDPRQLGLGQGTPSSNPSSAIPAQ